MTIRLLSHPIPNHCQHIGRRSLQVIHSQFRRSSQFALLACLTACLLATLLPTTVNAQDDGATADPPPATTGVDRDPKTGRKIHDGEPIYLSFNQVKIEDTIPFIVETTGKTVIPLRSAQTQSITIISDQPLTRDEALNQLFIAFLDLRIGVIETKNIIKIGAMEELGAGEVPVIGPSESLADRTDDGVIINKIFRLRHTSAGPTAEVLSEFIPDWASVEVEEGSNTIVTLCSVGLGKKLESMINDIDQPKVATTKTFLLRYADAATIAERIIEFYGEDDDEAGGNNRNNNIPQQFRRGGGNQGDAGGGSASGGGGAAPLRAVADTRNNSITVSAAPELLAEIERQITEFWDVKIDPKRDQIVKIYDIQYSDAVVVSNILKEIMDEQTTSIGGGGGRNPGVQGGGSGGGSGSTRLADLYRIQPMASVNRIIAIAKTSASFEYLDQIIADIDKPGMDIQPLVIELKHADAEELANEINVALQEPGLRINFEGREDDLTDFDPGTSFDDNNNQTQNQTQQSQNSAQFPWQAAREDENAAPVHELIGKVRVMPIFRQNAVLIVGPPHYQDRIRTLVEQLDRPGRQVLITAIIAEVELEDLLALGLRWGRSDVFGAPRDNQLSAGTNFTGTENDFLDGVFDTTVLTSNFNVNALIEALDRDTDIRILSTPRIFTHDNEQADFFDGQDIQFVTDTVTDIQTGNLNQGFDFRQVGITLSARPRITANRDVDLQVNLELSSLGAGTTATGGQIINKRVTSTRVVVEDGQTIVISGILREQEQAIKRKLPLLGDIPLLGAAFTSIENQTTRSELIAFVRPIVIDNPSENELLNEPYRERLEFLQRSLNDQIKNQDDYRDAWNTQGEGGPIGISEEINNDRLRSGSDITELPEVELNEESGEIDAFDDTDWELIEDE